MPIVTTSWQAAVAIAGGLLAIWIVTSSLTANDAATKGFPFWPIFVAALFLSFPLVLLIVTLAPPRGPSPGAMPARWRKF